MWSFALEHRAYWIDRSFKWQTRKFLAHFWHFGNSIKGNEIDIAFQRITLSTQLMFCYFNFMNTIQYEIHFPMIIPFLQVFFCHFEPLVHRQHWLALKIEIFRWISDFYRDWRKIPSLPRDAEMSHRIWQEETRCDEDGHCVSRDTAGNTSWWQLILGAWSYTELLRLRRPWLCCYNNYYYADTGPGNITLLCNT